MNPRTVSAQRPYGQWNSPIDPKLALTRPGTAQWPERQGNCRYWVQSLPEQGGRLVLMCQAEDSSVRTVTPDGFNIRTRVHEYGGRSHVIDGDWVYFVNFEDQVLYRQHLITPSEHSNTPQPMTLAGDQAWLLADPVVVDDNWLVFVGEQSQVAGENINALIAIKREAEPTDEAVVLHKVDDFYACPVVCADQQRLAFFSWCHPNMPWDCSKLWVADLHLSAQSIQVGNVNALVNEDDQSVCQLLFRRNGDLVFAMDRKTESSDPDQTGNFWNLYGLRSSDAGESLHQYTITRDCVEYGAAHWVFGNRRVVETKDQKLLAIRTAQSTDQLVMISDQAIDIIESDAVKFSCLSSSRDDRVLAVAEYRDRDACIVELNPATGVLSEVRIDGHPEQNLTALATNVFSVPKQIEVPTRDHASTFAWLYEPRNSAFTAPVNQLPPLMVLVHGGPTSRAESSLDLTRQYWTSRGFAVVDVNHRGSTGFGRRYRQALLGGWGEIDVDDVADVVTHLVVEKQVDGKRVFIRGSSAGGYAVLRALTRHPDIFCAGASYYGIGNLVTLARSTHKFESRYLDGLLGEPFNESQADDQDYVYYQRSPINFISDLANPMILFQGSEDRVVPPEVSREVVAVLTAQGLKHEYVEYAGEGHGFRKAENRIDALSKETRFTNAVLASQEPE